jgi:hypothetical protein
MSQNTASPFEKYKSTLETINQHIFTSINDLTIDAWKTNEPVPYADRKTGENRSLSLGDRWGDLFDCAWMQFTGEIPANISGEKIVCIINISGEANVVDDNGNPKSCLTTRYSNFGPMANDNEWFTLEVKVEGKHVVTKVNGKVVVNYNELEGVTAGRRINKGSFAIQAHDPKSVVRYRNIMLKELD